MVGVSESTKERMKKAKDCSKLSNLDELINDALDSYEGPRKKIWVKCKEIGELMDIEVRDKNYIEIMMYLHPILMSLLDDPINKNKLHNKMKEYMGEVKK